MKRLAWLILLAGCGGSPGATTPQDETLQRLAHAGDIAYTLEEPGQAADQYRAALARARQRDDAAAIDDAGFNLATAELRENRPKAAMATAQEIGAEIARRGVVDPALDLITATALFRLDKPDAADRVGSGSDRNQKPGAGRCRVVPARTDRRCAWRSRDACAGCSFIVTCCGRRGQSRTPGPHRPRSGDCAACRRPPARPRSTIAGWRVHLRWRRASRSIQRQRLIFSCAPGAAPRSSTIRLRPAPGFCRPVRRRPMPPCAPRSTTFCAGFRQSAGRERSCRGTDLSHVAVSGWGAPPRLSAWCQTEGKAARPRYRI